MSAQTLHISGLTVGYGSRCIIRDLNVSPIAAGGVTALVGPNGAGKSTLLRAIAGLLPATGKVVLNGRDLLAMSRQERAKLVGFMPQSLPAGVGLSVLETIVTALKVASPIANEKLLRRRAVAVLERLNAVHLALDPLERLSGGQRQMAGLAQALAPDPELLLLDEPTSALDLRHQFHIMRTVRELVRAGGRSAVIVLHDLALAAQWADTIVVLRGGGLHVEGPPAVAVTPDMLRDVYGVTAEVIDLSGGALHIAIKDLAEADTPVRQATGSTS